MSTLLKTYVPPESPNNRILFCAEAPGETEERNGRPLVGLAGQLFEGITNSLNLYRGKDYGCTNVCKFRPTNNDWTGLPKAIKETKYQEIRAEIASYNAVSTIICLGAAATRALTSMQDALGNDLSFTKMRGCFWESLVTNPNTGKPYKVMVTHHPSACLRQAASPIELKRDIQKALKYLDQDILIYDQTPGDDFLLDSPNSMLSWLPSLMEKPILAYDVETMPRGDGHWYVDCISFAWSSTEGVCFDLLRNEQKVIGYKLEPIFMRPDAWFCGQNVTYDQQALERTFGYCPSGNHIDTLDMHALLDPGRPHNLGYLNACYNNRPYFKDEDKKIDKKLKIRKDRLRYNLQDTLATYGAFETMAAQLEEVGLWQRN